MKFRGTDSADCRSKEKVKFRIKVTQIRTDLHNVIWNWSAFFMFIINC